VRIATLSNASVEHTRRWARWFRSRGHDLQVWSLEPPLEGLEAERLPCAPLPGFLRYPLALPASSPSSASLRTSWTRTTCPTTGCSAPSRGGARSR
jgi:hypothetical protein